MKIPYTVIHTPEGYELDADTRTAFMPPINLSVDASSKSEAITLLSQLANKTLQGLRGVAWPEVDDWIPGDGEIEINP